MDFIEERTNALRRLPLLADSEFFLLLASPEAAQSPWVQKEAAFWSENKSVEKLLVVLTSGALVWENEKGDFDWSRTDALPQTLRSAFSAEPLYVDLSWAREQEHLSLQDARFRGDITRLAATLHNKPLDEIAGEDVRQHRRTIRIARLAVLSLAVLTIAAVAGAVVAVQQRNTAEDQRRIADERRLEAERQSRRALAQLLAIRSQDALERTPQLGLLLA